MEDLRLRQTPAPMQRLRRSTLLVGALLAVLLVGALAYLKAQIPPLAQLLAREQVPTPAPVALPESLKAVERPYSELQAPKPVPPLAQPLPKPPAPAPPVAAPVVAPLPVQAQADPLPEFLELMKKNQAITKDLATQAPSPPQPAPPQKPARVAWRIKPTDITIKRDGEKGGEASKAEKDAVARQGEASKLITPAIWARPAKPWATLFMDQKIPGKLIDNINSDTPGINNIETTVPIFDGTGWGGEILPKGSKITIRQEGKPDFGATTLSVKVIQVRLPGREGVVVKFPGSVGDENGASGVRGKTDNHYGRLLAAAGINALISLGGNSLAGTPGNGQFYQTPIQQSIKETSASISRDAQKLVEAQLKIPPTITKSAGEFVTIQLEENITFSRRPVVVR
jgi:type IV secretion system protein VirB10